MHVVEWWNQYEHAWSMWKSGQLPASSPLWGHSILFWGRAGKLTQFFAGLVVIFDLIGPHWLIERQQELARQRRHLKQVVRNWREQQENIKVAFLLNLWLVLKFLEFLDVFDSGSENSDDESDSDSENSDDEYPLLGGLAALLWAGFGFLSGAVTAYISYKRFIGSFGQGPDVTLVGSGIVGLLAISVTLVSGYLLWLGFLWVVQGALGGLIILLNAKEEGHPLRWIMFVVFVIGFTFDLLES